MRKSKVVILVCGVFLLFVLYRLYLTLGFTPGANVPTHAVIVTKYRDEVFRQYADTFLALNPEYRSPVELYNENDHLSIVAIYFEDEPEELYEVSIGSSSVRYIYKMKNGAILYSLDNPTAEDIDRVKTRLGGIWLQIENLIEAANLPDSVKYYSR